MGSSDFGDPTATTGYVLCVYDDDVLAMGVQIPADGTCGTKPCWKATSTKGFRYHDRTTTPDGTKAMSLRSGDAGKAKVRLRGSGEHLPVPPLPFAAPVRVQLRRTDAPLCWEAAYAASLKSTATQFKAKSE